MILALRISALIRRRIGVPLYMPFHAQVVSDL